MEQNQANDQYISILFPDNDPEHYFTLSDITMHDLGMDSVAQKLSAEPREQALLLRIMSKMTGDPKISKFRADVFEDIRSDKNMRDRMMKLLDHVDFLREYGTFKRGTDENAGVWDLLHRLDEIRDYIETVEAIYECLKTAPIKSEGLRELRDFVDRIYHDNGFEALKKDINGLRSTTSSLKSVTLGINLNERFEAWQIGLVSLNSKPFTKAPILSNFYEHLTKKDEIKDSTEWKGDTHFHPVYEEDGAILKGIGKVAITQAMMSNPVLALGMGSVANGDEVQNVTRYLDRITNRMLAVSTARLREVLSRHVTVRIGTITALIPEFVYYIRWAEFLEKLEAKGFRFAKPEVMDSEDSRCMDAKGIYNLKLAFTETEEAGNIVPNDLDFSEDHRVYILTGANRGGKTTITQAIGILYVLAQGGIYIPGESFRFDPVDRIFTHYPADEDKTMDLGRLGEECSRFRELFRQSTGKSLLLLNETFSTTSFEEGYYIACDAVRAILNKGVRTIYNTHMHKLAYDLEELNENAVKGKAASLIVESEEGRRSYRVKVAPPMGSSFARDIAVKYGVTYEELTEGL